MFRLLRLDEKSNFLLRLWSDQRLAAKVCIFTARRFTARRVCIAQTMPWQDVCRPSVCMSVRLLHAGIESKRLYISLQFLYHRVALPF